MQPANKTQAEEIRITSVDFMTAPFGSLDLHVNDTDDNVRMKYGKRMIK
jgi:hypothetical protein